MGAEDNNRPAKWSDVLLLGLVFPLVLLGPLLIFVLTFTRWWEIVEQDSNYWSLYLAGLAALLGYWALVWAVLGKALTRLFSEHIFRRLVLDRLARWAKVLLSIVGHALGAGLVVALGFLAARFGRDLFRGYASLWPMLLASFVLLVLWWVVLLATVTHWIDRVFVLPIWFRRARERIGEGRRTLLRGRQFRRFRRTARRALVGGLYLLGLWALFLAILAWDQPVGVERAPFFIRLGHRVTAPTILLLFGWLFVLRTRRRKQKRALDNLERIMDELHERGMLGVVTNPDRDACRTMISLLLKELLDSTERWRTLAQLFYPRRGPRSAWILVPDQANGFFRTVLYYPLDAAYEGVAEHHRPATWQADEARRLASELVQVKRDYKGQAMITRAAEIRTRLRAHTSLTGYIYYRGGPRAYPWLGPRKAVFDASLDAFDDSYLDQIPEKKRTRYSFGSAAGTRLEIGARKIGVLMLYDTLYGGWVSDNGQLVKIYAYLLAPLVGYCFCGLGPVKATSQSSK